MESKTENNAIAVSIVPEETVDSSVTPIILGNTRETIDLNSEFELIFTRRQLNARTKYLDIKYDFYSEEDRHQYINTMYELRLKDLNQFVDTMYELWTFGNRYTTYFFYGNGRLHFSLTFIRLEGFSNAIIVNPYPNPYPDDTDREEFGYILLSDSNVFYTLTLGGMHFGDSFEFYARDDGLVVLSSGTNNQFYLVNWLEIQYKYLNDELVLFLFGNDESQKFEMTEIIYQDDNKMIININDATTFDKEKCVFVNEDIEKLRLLYTTVLRKNFISAIDYLVEYRFSKDRGREGRLYEVLGAWNLKLLGEAEMAIFEECLAEYFYGRDERFKESHNYRQIMELLEEVKK
jgi:hypothetical protein